MSIKTWREREFDAIGFVAVSPASNVIHMQAEIDELRAALQERDEEIERMAQASAIMHRWKTEDDEMIAAQRKVLETALEAFTETMSMYLEWHKDFPEHVGDKEKPVVQLAKQAITAIQEQLK